MKSNSLVTVTFLSGSLAGMFLGLGAIRLTPPVKAAPVKETAPAKETATTASTAAPMADFFSGKTHPLTLLAEKIDPSYHLVALVDAQGKPTLVATHGETVSAGGDTFLVCYDVPLTNTPPQPPQPKAGTVGNLLYVNLHSVQAMGGIISITPATTAAPAAALP